MSLGSGRRQSRDRHVGAKSTRDSKEKKTDGHFLLSPLTSLHFCPLSTTTMAPLLLVSSCRRAVQYLLLLAVLVLLQSPYSCDAFWSAAEEEETVAAAAATKSSDEPVEYGVDVSFPMHHAKASDNYAWLPHNLDPSLPVPDRYKGMAVQPLGDRQYVCLFLFIFLQQCH